MLCSLQQTAFAPFPVLALVFVEFPAFVGHFHVRRLFFIFPPSDGNSHQPLEQMKEISTLNRHHVTLISTTLLRDRHY